MATEEKLNDVDYCYAAWELLTVLEKDSYARNQAIRDFREKADRRESFISVLLAVILPLILWGYLLAFSSEAGGFLNVGRGGTSFATGLFGVIMMTVFLFIAVFLLVRTLWTRRLFHSLREFAERDLKQKLIEEVNEIDKSAAEVVNTSVFTQPRVPEDLLSVEILPILIRYFETEQANTMKKAVYFLNLELQNASHYAGFLPKETLLQREREYLSDVKGNLDKKIGEREERQ